MSDEKLKKGHKWVYTPYITVNGKRRYKKDGGVFKFQVPINNTGKKTKKKDK